MSLDERIITELRKHPLLSYRKIASNLGISPHTVSRRIIRLQESGFSFQFISSFHPSALSLIRYVVFYDISNLKQAQNTMKSIECFRYIRSFNRMFGSEHKIIAFFDLPETVSSYLYDFNDYLVSLGFCNSFSVHRSIGYYYGSKTLFPHPFSKVNFSTKDIVDYFSKFLDAKKTLPKDTIETKLHFLTPIHFYIIDKLQNNVRLKPSEILIRNQFEDLKKKELDRLGKTQYVQDGDSTLENLNYFFGQVEQYLFESEISKGSLLVDLNRKYHFILKNILYNPRLRFSRSHFLEYTTRSYLFQRNEKSKAVQLFNYLLSNPPPFHVNFNLFDDVFLFRVTLPHQFDAHLNRAILDFFPSHRSYALDFFQKFGIFYTLDLLNFDYKEGNWRTDEYWMLECPKNEMKMKKIT